MPPNLFMFEGVGSPGVRTAGKISLTVARMECGNPAGKYHGSDARVDDE
jgi:hypothetical protein